MDRAWLARSPSMLRAAGSLARASSWRLGRETATRSSWRAGPLSRLAVPLVAFVYFTGEERWRRAQLLSHTRSIPGIATPVERVAAVQRDIERLRRVLAQATAVVVPTDYVRGQLAALVDPPQATKVLVAYHGVDPAVFPPRAEGWGAGGPWLHVSRTAVPFAGCKNVAWSARLLAAARLRGACQIVCVSDSDLTCY